MNTLNIPSFFWYSVSFCMLLSTAVLLWIAYQSSSISIEVADTKIHLSSAIHKVEVISQELESKEEGLVRAISSLNKVIKDKDIKISSLSNSQCTKEELQEENACFAPNDIFLNEDIFKSGKFKDLQNSIKEASISINNIKIK